MGGVVGRSSAGVRPDLIVLAAATVSAGMMIRNGRYHPVALGLVVVGAGLFYAGTLRSGTVSQAALARRARMAYVLQAAALLGSVSRHLVDLLRAGEAVLGTVLVLATLAVLGVGWDAIGPRPRLERLWLPCLAAGVTIMVLTVVIGLGPVLNDVYHLQTLGIDRLFDGVSPYAPGYPDIYAPRFSREFYGPDLSIDGVLQFGYAYPPISLLLAIPGWLLGDVRLASLGAVLVTAWLMARTGEGWPGRLAGASFLTSAPILFVVTQGWTEPFVVALLALFVYLHRRGPGTALAAAAFGLFVTSKQYGLLFVPLYGLLIPRPIIWKSLARQIVLGLAAAAVVAVPFLVWDWRGAWTSMVSHLLSLPIRKDALSLLGIAPDVGLVATVAPFVAATVALAVVLRRAPRDSSGFAVGIGVVLVTSVLFAKQAFANYFFTVMAAGLLAVAVSGNLVPIRDNGDYAE